jgi:hypothetical protein
VTVDAFRDEMSNLAVSLEKLGLSSRLEPKQEDDPALAFAHPGSHE